MVHNSGADHIEPDGYMVTVRQEFVDRNGYHREEKTSVPELFEKTSIKSLELENRAVRSATWSGVCDSKGYITEMALEFYGNLAQGGIGLIVTGFQYVMPNSIAMPFQMGNYRDDQLEGLTRLVETIHSRAERWQRSLHIPEARRTRNCFSRKQRYGVLRQYLIRYPDRCRKK